MSLFRVVGLDLSLTSTGMSDGQSVHAVTTSKDSGDCLEARMDKILCRVITFVYSPSQWTDAQPAGKVADLVVIEGPAFKAHGTAVDQLAGLRMIVRHKLYRMGIPFAVVSPTALKAYTAGHGRATKAEMVAALAERHQLDLTRYKVAHGKYDMADAYSLAAMGYAVLDQPLPTYHPSTRHVSLLTVPWPELPTVPSTPDN
jgi:Holliday junction resolvasome RuvABC endonuclease subunit